jgi:hypothetical protein
VPLASSNPTSASYPDQFLAEVRGLKYKNVAAELLAKLLGDGNQSPFETKPRSKPQVFRRNGCAATAGPSNTALFPCEILRRPVDPSASGEDLSPVSVQPGLLRIEVACQGKVGELITKGGLKSDGHNLPIGLKSSPVSSAIEIAERGAHLAADTEGGVE